MSAEPPKCTVAGCGFYASATSTTCSAHSEEGKARSAAKKQEKNALEARVQQELREGKDWWTSNRPPSTGGEGMYLIIGAAPHEDRRGRDYYEDKHVFLLGHEHRRKPPPQIDYSRYIEVDYEPQYAEELEAKSQEYLGMFDEMTFDYSTMCAFNNGYSSIRKRLQSFSNMLKDNGVFFLTQHSPEIQSALESIGFQVSRVKLKDLEGDTIINRLEKENPEYPIVVAIKTPTYGGRRKRVRKTRKRRKSYKARKYSRIVKK